MGTDKATLPVDGVAMSLMLAEKYISLGPVAFSVDRRGRFPTGEYLELEDRYPGCGPLNGIVSAFSETEEEIVFLTATDMPGGSAEAVKELLRYLGQHDACIFRGEPLFGVYRRCCLGAAVACLEEGERSMRSFLRRIDVAEIESACPNIFANLNTQEEYRRFLDNAKQVL